MAWWAGGALAYGWAGEWGGGLGDVWGGVLGGGWVPWSEHGWESEWVAGWVAGWVDGWGGVSVWGCQAATEYCPEVHPWRGSGEEAEGACVVCCQGWSRCPEWCQVLCRAAFQELSLA